MSAQQTVTKIVQELDQLPTRDFVGVAKEFANLVRELNDVSDEHVVFMLIWMSCAAKRLLDHEQGAGDATD